MEVTTEQHYDAQRGYVVDVRIGLDGETWKYSIAYAMWSPPYDTRKAMRAALAADLGAEPAQA